MNLSKIITELENKNGIYIYNNKSYFPKVDLDFDRTGFKPGDEKIYVKDSVTGKRFYVLLLKLYNTDVEDMLRMDIRLNRNIYILKLFECFPLKIIHVEQMALLFNRQKITMM